MFRRALNIIAIGLALLCIASAPTLQAQPEINPESGHIERPESRPILAIKGNLEVTSEGTTAYFDYAQLKSFPQHEIEVNTPWFNGPRNQSGPLLSDVLAFVKASGDTLLATALNDYLSRIPMSDVENYPIILAIDKDGKPMRIRDMGPVFVIYPFHSFPELRDETYYARSVWQVKSLTIE